MIEKKKLKDELKFLLWANENQRVMDLRNELHRTNEDMANMPDYLLQNNEEAVAEFNNLIQRARDLREIDIPAAKLEADELEEDYDFLEDDIGEYDGRKSQKSKSRRKLRTSRRKSKRKSKRKLRKSRAKSRRSKIMKSLKKLLKSLKIRRRKM